jgi:hypothetical protein
VKNRLFAMLILASWTQVKGDERLRPAPPRDKIVVGVSSMVGGNRQVRQVTLTMPAPPTPDDECEDHPPVRPARLLNINAAEVEGENFERWLFPDEHTEEARQTHLDDILRAKIENAYREQNLTGPQRAKLRLAGRGDIKRFFDQVQDERNAFEIERKTVHAGLAALRRLDPLVQIYQEGPFGDGSLFAKTLHRINVDQKAGP